MFLSTEIRRAREARGLSTDELARTLYVSESLVRSWEKARRLPKPDIMVKLEEALGTGGILARILSELVDAAVPVEWFGRWVDIERGASALWSFELAVVPGLLQTEQYASAVLRAMNHSAELEEMLSSRMERQQIFAKEDPPMLVALIAESVLRHNVGGAKVMHDQCRHLAEMAQRSDVIVQVIPAESTVCAGFLSGFAIASLDGDDFAYVDNQLSGDVIESVEGVSRLRRWFDVFRSDALSQSDSIGVIEGMAEKWML
ncbi:Scr1 family TA system antitoxin-like transcriptional regulator [Actinocorallia sp. B10E7]|uniref:helix-turn-helix domain-containing protein n=1 Tax=Actinocorallia sp. B10E7 TaxID=3153558 RepID=UPI00325E11F4